MRKYGYMREGGDFEIEYFSALNNYEDNPRGVVREACEHAWYSNNGWEWLRTGERFGIYDEEGRLLGSFEIEVDSVPQFTVHR